MESYFTPEEYGRIMGLLAAPIKLAKDSMEFRAASLASWVGDTWAQNLEWLKTSILGGLIAEVVRWPVASADAHLEFETPATSFAYGNRWVSSAGDIDDDGLDDVLIGTPNRTVVCSGGVESDSAGGAYLLFGPLSGTIGEQDVDLAISSGSCEMVGHEVASVGDVNANGFDDILLGAPNIWVDDDWYYDLGYGAGGAYLFLGPLGSGTVGTSDADLFFAGEAEGDVAGYTVAAAGDPDSDGISDFVIGAPMLDDPVDKSGAAYVILGGEDLLERYAAE